MYEAVITGLGPIAPNGVGKELFWEAITSGKTGVRRISSFEAADCSCQIAGNIPMEWMVEHYRNLPDWLPDSKACKYSVLAMLLALEDAELTVEDIAKRSSAVYMGISTTDMEVVDREYKYQISNGRPRSDSLISAFPHTPTVCISRILKSYTKVFTISTACTSGLNSIIIAADCIARGEADIVIAGGVETPLSPLVMNGFCSAGMVPTDYNEIPEKACRPFDHKRQGGVLSEGAGVIVLEEKGKALRRKAKIYASFSGGGLSTEMSPMRIKTTIYDAMAQALSSARLKVNQIDYICACAPGDPIIDRAETMAIKKLFGSHAYNIPVSSIKSMIGNPGAGAGPLQAITAALAIDCNYVPPTINLEKPGKSCDLDFVQNRGKVARVNRVLVNVRGFGGGVSSLVLSRSN